MKIACELHGFHEIKRCFDPGALHPDCTKAGDAGIGSVVHHMGQALALAIELNRTLVVAPDVGYPYTDTERCSLIPIAGPEGKPKPARGFTHCSAVLQHVLATLR